MPVPVIALVGVAAAAALFMFKKKEPEIIITNRDADGNVVSTRERAEDGTVVTRDAKGKVIAIATVEDGVVTNRDASGNVIEDDPVGESQVIEVTDIKPNDIPQESVYDKTLSKADQARIMNAWRTALLSQDPDALLKIKSDVVRLVGPAAATDIDSIVATWREYAMPKGVVTKTKTGVVVETVNAAIEQQAKVEEVRRDAIDSGMVVPPAEPAASVSAPKLVVPSVPLYGDLTASRKVLAAKVALTIQTSTKGKENQQLVRDFEVQEGITPSGKYGVNVALALVHYGICPPKPPFYWGRVGDYSSIAREKQQYKSALLAKAMTDNSRASEWKAAAAQVK